VYHNQSVALTKLILQQKTSIDDGVPEVALMIVDAIFPPPSCDGSIGETSE